MTPHFYARVDEAANGRSLARRTFADPREASLFLAKVLDVDGKDLGLLLEGRVIETDLGPRSVLARVRMCHCSFPYVHSQGGPAFRLRPLGGHLRFVWLREALDPFEVLRFNNDAELAVHLHKHHGLHDQYIAWLMVTGKVTTGTTRPIRRNAMYLRWCDCVSEETNVWRGRAA